MNAEAAARAAESNPRAHLVTIPGVRHHLLLERPDMLAVAIRDFAASLDQSS
jgi:alpha-beta hydrolase superfamily lysophospholipase